MEEKKSFGKAKLMVRSRWGKAVYRLKKSVHRRDVGGFTEAD